MAMRNRRLVKTVWVVGVASTASSAIGVMPASGGNERSLHGVFAETAAGSAAGYDLHGSAKLTTGPDGTSAKVSVSGLDPEKSYGSHLHNGTCASGGGGHYQDVEGGLVTPPNELWLSSGNGPLVANSGGVAHGAGSATWTARLTSDASNARSVVVHEPGSGARIACADLG